VFKVISEVLPREYAHLRVDRADMILHRVALRYGARDINAGRLRRRGAETSVLSATRQAADSFGPASTIWMLIGATSRIASGSRTASTMS
jgi:hypothetical protein